MNQQGPNPLPTPGTCVAVLVSDPWDAVDHLPTNPFPTKVIAIGDDENDLGALLLRVDKPFPLQNKHCEYFVATRRHEEPKGHVRNWEECGYNLTRISADQALGAAPFEDRWSAGEVGLLATLKSTGSR